MAPTPEKKAVAKPAKAPAAAAGKVAKTRKPRSRNYALGNGIVRFSKTKMFHKKVSVVFQSDLIDMLTS